MSAKSNRVQAVPTRSPTADSSRDSLSEAEDVKVSLQGLDARVGAVEMALQENTSAMQQLALAINALNPPASGRTGRVVELMSPRTLQQRTARRRAGAGAGGAAPVSRNGDLAVETMEHEHEHEHELRRAESSPVAGHRERKEKKEDEELGAIMRRGMRDDTLRAEAAREAGEPATPTSPQVQEPHHRSALERTTSRKHSLIQLRSVAMAVTASAMGKNRARREALPIKKNPSRFGGLALDTQMEANSFIDGDRSAPSTPRFPGNTPRGMQLESLQIPPEKREQMLAQLRTREQMRRIIKHDSNSRACWDLLMVFLVLYVLVEVPFDTAFHSGSLQGTDALTWVIDSMFFLDILLNFRTSYVDRGTGDPVFDSKLIAKHYLHGFFLVDLLSCMPFDRLGDVTANSPDAGVLKALKLLRMIRVGKLFKKMDQILQASAFRVVRLLAFVILVSHWVACFWWMVGSDQWGETYTTYSGQLLAEASTADQYAVCFYTAISLLFRNVQVPPQSNAEVYFASGVVVVGACLQASVFGSVAVLLAGLDEDEWRYRKHIGVVEERMKQLALPKTLQDRVLVYYEQIWLRQRTLKIDADDFIHDLSPALQVDVRLCMFEDMVRKVPFLRNKPGSKNKIGAIIVEALVAALTTHVYLKDDVIMRKGEAGDWMGFIGPGGRVAILDPRSRERKVIRVLGVGEYVGELALLLAMRRTADVVSLSWLRLFVLTRGDFENVRLQYPSEMREVEAGLDEQRRKMKYVFDKS